MTHAEAIAAVCARFQTAWSSRCKVIWPNVGGEEAETPRTSTATGSLTVTLSTRRMTLVGAFAQMKQLDVFALSGTVLYNRRFTIKQKISDDVVVVADHDTITADETAAAATLTSILSYVRFDVIADHDSQAWMSDVTGYRNDCFVSASIFTPQGEGFREIWGLKEVVKWAFRGNTIAGELFFSSRVSYSPPLRSGEMYQVTVSVPFYFEETGNTVPVFEPDVFEPEVFEA